MFYITNSFGICQRSTTHQSCRLHSFYIGHVRRS